MGAIDFLGVQNDCIFMNIFNPEIFVNNLAIFFFIRRPVKMIRSLMVHTERIGTYKAPLFYKSHFSSLGSLDYERL